MLTDIFSHDRQQEKDAYYRSQINQSVGKIDKDARFRYTRIIGHILKEAGWTDVSQKRVVCVGCRNTHELRAFDTAGFGEVVGIDLFSTSSRITIMDMHHLTFPDHTFDVVYSADSLEHSHTPAVAIANMVRVLKPGGLICISTPIQWRKTLGRESEDLSTVADCQDFSSPEEVYGLFGSISYRTVFEEIYKSPDGVTNLLALITVP